MNIKSIKKSLFNKRILSSEEIMLKAYKMNSKYNVRLLRIINKNVNINNSGLKLNRSLKESMNNILKVEIKKGTYILNRVVKYNKIKHPQLIMNI